jgi:uncharacterized protein (DUF736 family)
MPAIGYVTRQPSGDYKGYLRTLSLRAEIEIVANANKSTETQPDFRVVTKAGYEIGAAWARVSENTGNKYVSLSLSAPEFGRHRLYANLGRAAGQEDPDVFAIIWNPQD